MFYRGFTDAERKSGQATRLKHLLESDIIFEHHHTTNKYKIDTLISRGFLPITRTVPDREVISRAQKEIDRINSGWGLPRGNPNHPLVRRFNKLKADLESQPTCQEYYLVKDAIEYKIGKLLWEYALTLEGDPLCLTEI